MTRAALQIAEDDVLGLAPAGATHVSGLSGPGLQLEHVGQAEAQHAGAANAQEVATGHFQVRIAQVLSKFSGYRNHVFSLCFNSKKSPFWESYHFLDARQRLKRKAGLLISAQAMSCAAVKRMLS